LTTSNLSVILLRVVLALSPASAQAPSGFFPPKSTHVSPVVSALTYVLIPKAFKSSRFRTYAIPGVGAPSPPSILDFTFTPAYRTLSVAFPMTYAISQRRQPARILPPRILNILPSARLV
jgi:hypothetical protein